MDRNQSEIIKTIPNLLQTEIAGEKLFRQIDTIHDSFFFTNTRGRIVNLSVRYGYITTLVEFTVVNIRI